MEFKNLLFKAQDLLDINVSNEDEIIDADILAYRGISFGYIIITPYLIGKDRIQIFDQTNFITEERQYLKEAIGWIYKFVYVKDITVSLELVISIIELMNTLYQYQSQHNNPILCGKHLKEALNKIKVFYQKAKIRISDKYVYEIISQVMEKMEGND